MLIMLLIHMIMKISICNKYIDNNISKKRLIIIFTKIIIMLIMMMIMIIKTIILLPKLVVKVVVLGLLLLLLPLLLLLFLLLLWFLPLIGYIHISACTTSGTNSSWGPYYCCAKHSRIACFPTFKFNLCYSKKLILWEVEKDIL